VYTPRIGVAYRQKTSGMVFRETALHARASDAIIARQFVDLSDTENPPLFSKALANYIEDRARARRLLRSYALAAAVGDEDGAREIRALLPESLTLLVACGFDACAELDAGLTRASRALPEMRDRGTRQSVRDRLEAELFGDDLESPPVEEVRS